METPKAKSEVKPNSSEKSLKAHQQQFASDGFGAVYHRVYSVRFFGGYGRALEVMKKLQSNLNEFSPQLLADFEKVDGHPGRLRQGDRYQIHISGPWNGPVEVRNVQPNSFTLVTLEGHMEAGEIHFRVKELSGDQSIFEIESLAKSRDRLVDFVYDKLPIAKMAQTEMWTSFCQAVAAQASHQEDRDPKQDIEIGVISKVDVVTERRDEETGEWVKL